VQDFDTELLRERAAKVLAGGVLFHRQAFGRPPTIIVRGEGSRIWDSEGREYIDYHMGSASLMLGHSHPEIVEAVTRQLPQGSQFFALNVPAIELAELIVATVPSAERVKYSMSGTDAIVAGIRVARAQTRKSKIIKFEGAYHGSHDMMLWGTYNSGAFAYPAAPPDSPGLPAELQSLTLVVPYNHFEHFERAMRENRSDLAAVVVEPFLNNVRPKEGFLAHVRRLTSEMEIPLIFDEVVTGYRLALGGAQEYYGVTPDLTALGKSLGGGLPIGALVGRADLMEWFSPDRVASGQSVLHVGTLSGNPLSCVAGAATVRILRRPGTYERLSAMGRRLGDGLREISARHGFRTLVIDEGAIVDLVFIEGALESYRDGWKADRQLSHRYKLGLLDRGIWSPPRLKMYLSLAHTDADIDRTLDAAETSMRSLR